MRAVLVMKAALFYLGQVEMLPAMFMCVYSIFMCVYSIAEPDLNLSWWLRLGLRTGLRVFDYSRKGRQGY